MKIPHFKETCASCHLRWKCCNTHCLGKSHDLFSIKVILLKIGVLFRRKVFYIECMGTQLNAFKLSLNLKAGLGVLELVVADITMIEAALENLG